MISKNAFLIDINLCIGCEACVDACKAENSQLLGESEGVSASSYTTLHEEGDLYVRRMCMHCEYPTCVSVCPVGAFEKTDLGPVVYHYEKCMGCRYCMQACPFNVPTYEWHKMQPRVQKCHMCISRQRVGQIPACAEACPTGATLFGPREEMLKIARQRIADDPDMYYDHIYGEKEAGGTSVLFLSPVPFEQLGFPVNIPNAPLPNLTWEVLSKIPNFSIAAAVLFYGVWWIIDRRMELDKTNGKEETGKFTQERIKQ